MANGMDRYRVITLTWNVLMLSFNGISYCVAANKTATEKKKATNLILRASSLPPLRHERKTIR